MVPNKGYLGSNRGLGIWSPTKAPRSEWSVVFASRALGGRGLFLHHADPDSESRLGFRALGA